MEKIDVQSKHGKYPILIEEGIFDQAGHWIRRWVPSAQLAIITDTNVGKIYLERLKTGLKQAGMSSADVYVIEAGEESKNLQTVEMIYHWLLEKGHDRSSGIIALGGGVVGDLTGFVASTFMRGLPFVQVPTSLLAQVDSSVGGKVGVNVMEGKNLVGSFYAPKGVIIDPLVLKTLPMRQFRNGIAEIVKTGAILDANLLQEVAKLHDAVELRPAWGKVIARCCDLKAMVVSQDEEERGLRKILNFGHSFGHVIEQFTEYKKYAHGEAVAIGMIMAAQLGRKLEITEAEVEEELTALLRQFNLPIQSIPIPTEDWIAVMKKDKKKSKGLLHLVALKEMGQAVVRPVEYGLIEEFLKEVAR
jgi:3-dehydroquinate synthase